ncbi:MAG: pimeloyl-[acyl-carrier protein] methyl ester esterase [Hydrogenophilales bacterium 28-61-23]|nr:MAG: pimeloyl-[acyl-carrier protein] methyl ester esterase [Hydrogenophilales bacterium 28-61-23]
MREPPLIYLHGWGLHGGIWAETAALLPGLTPDLPGYGEAASTTPYSAEGLADALAATLPDGAAVCAWSLGGMVALALAARHPHKVGRLALVATNPAFVSRQDWPHGLAPEVLAEFARALGEDYKATLLRFLSLQARGGDQARTVIERLRGSVFLRGEPAAETLAAGLDLLREVDLRGVVEQVRCPVLVVHGAYDMLCPPEAGRWLAQRLPNARLAPHERAAHAPFLSHPDWFVSELRAFLHG